MYTTTYVYDSANQLVRENNQAGGFTHTWTYDNAGNITSRKEYGYTTGDLETPDNVVSYTYPVANEGEDIWGDLLLSYNGKNITYDGVGNPLNDGTWEYTWEHGRQLASMSLLDGSTTWDYTYNADGMRIGRTDGNTTYTYTYNGDKLTYLIANNHQMYFAYDANGLPMSMILDGVMYYYVTNVQGDVISLLDSAGKEVASYTYDAWGNPISTTVSLASTAGVLNPLRYRGYIWDSETKLYYLQSRYYNPEIGRFINADGLTSTGQGLLGNNMFTYCNNNPVTAYDPNGMCSYSVYYGGKVQDGSCYRCKNAHAPKTIEYITDGLATGAAIGAFMAGGIPAAGITNNSINAIYYLFSSDKSYIEWDAVESSYTEGYITRWDRLNYTKQETGNRFYFFNAWRYNSEYSMHMYGWYAVEPFLGKDINWLEPYGESLKQVHIEPHAEDDEWKTRVLTYLFGLLGL